MMPAALNSADVWVIATAICCNVACGVLGCYLVLRRMSLLGDAISHAILPGLALAFILSGSRSIGPMLLGAMITGVLTALLSALLTRWGRVPEDAAMGVVFTSLFALGVVLITRFASSVDLDPGCVLYGLIEFVPLDTVSIAGRDVPRAFINLSAVMLVDLVLITLFFKELKIVAFDPYLATTMGISAGLVHYGLMTAVAATTVAAFESVGSILVVAMLIAPGATAHLLTDRLSRTLLLAAGSGAISAIVGYLLALYWNTSVAGMMSVVAGAQFALAALLAPRHGYVARLLRQAALAVRIVQEDILGMLYRWTEAGRRDALSRRDVLAAVGGGSAARLGLRLLAARGRVRRVPPAAFELTPSGLERARGLVRSHRLWERYLEKHLGMPLDHLHAGAARMEHFVSGPIEDSLAGEFADAPDPHGRRIPPRSPAP
jgi:manganese/zinc/iron transport system permease protein